MAYTKKIEVPVDYINRDELLKLMGSTEVLILDTIGTYDGNKYKIKGAKTIPFPDVIDRRSELTGYKEIIVYCKNKKCPASTVTAMRLKLQKVHNVKVYDGGIDEWTDTGLPVEEE
jgi:rhodanese-related sulfurtransferase